MKSQIYILPEEWHFIETYLDQKDDLRKLALNEKLNQITNFEQKIEYVAKIREEIEGTIRQSKIKEFHKHISEDEDDSDFNKTASKRINSKTIWFTAAAMLVVLFGIFWMMDSSSTSEEIFAKNFKPDVGLPLKMGTVATYGFYEGMLDYKQENYKEAIAKWQILLEENPDSDTLNYFLGVANLALGNADESLEYLQNQERFQQGMFKEDAAFYAALAKIKEGKYEEAKVFLKNNPSNTNTNLLKELEKQ